MDRWQKNDKTKTARELGRKTRDETAAGSQMTALRFQTRGRQSDTSPACLWGIVAGIFHWSCSLANKQHQNQKKKRTVNNSERQKQTQTKEKRAWSPMGPAFLSERPSSLTLNWFGSLLFCSVLRRECHHPDKPRDTEPLWQLLSLEHVWQVSQVLH